MMALVGLLLWVFVAVTVLGFLFWSVLVGVAQKKAWVEFAKRYKLNVEEGDKLRDPVALSGILNGRQINIYSEIEKNEEERTQRIYTHVEVFLGAAPATPFALSAKSIPETGAGLAESQVFLSTAPDWPKPAGAFADDPAKLGEWLTAPRMRALRQFFELASEKGVETLLIGDGNAAFMLWRGNRPLADPRVLNSLVQKLYGYARDFDGGETGTSAKPNASSETPSPETSA